MEQPEVECLFKSSALRISDAQRPFWYTSGEIGPYYINTHFLCGGEREAKEILDLITVESRNPKTLPGVLLARLEQLYERDEMYRGIIDSLSALIKERFDIAGIGGISGGQRRDWFFAPLVARQLGKPMLYLYNDGLAFDEWGNELDSLGGKIFLNVCDLLRVGSSYTSKWIPIVKKYGGDLLYSVSVVDRREGGERNLLDAGIKQSESLFSFDAALFRKAADDGFLDEQQLSLVTSYLADPRGSMRGFLQANPAFLQEALASKDEKLVGRARSLVENDFYELDVEL